MKCVIFELDGVLRDAEGNAVAGNVALAKSLYSAGHDVLIMRAKHAYEWLHANDIFYDDIMASHQQIDAERVAMAVVSDDVIYAAMRNAGIHCWLYK